MPVEFRLPQLVAGFCPQTLFAGEGDSVAIQVMEFVSPDAPILLSRLEALEANVFRYIPKMSAASNLKHLLVILRSDLTGTAYFNELDLQAVVKPKADRLRKPIKKGDTVYSQDIETISELSVGIDVPADSGVIFIGQTGWRRSLFYDFGPLQPEKKPRDYPLEQALGYQALLLLGLLRPERASLVEQWTEGFNALVELLKDRSVDESAYQRVLADNPWMFGGEYSEVSRHSSLDDKRIPDFVGTRCYDQCLDIFELKQPFLALFRQKGGLSASFNDAWNQAEEYLDFVHRQRLYLDSEKNLRFENPRCFLVVGYQLTEEERGLIRRKERNGAIRVITYDHLLKQAGHLLDLMQATSRRIEGRT